MKHHRMIRRAASFLCIFSLLTTNLTPTLAEDFSAPDNSNYTITEDEAVFPAEASAQSANAEEITTEEEPSFVIPESTQEAPAQEEAQAEADAVEEKATDSEDAVADAPEGNSFDASAGADAEDASADAAAGENAGAESGTVETLEGSVDVENPETESEADAEQDVSALDSEDASEDTEPEVFPEKELVATDNKTYRITVTYDSTSGIPKDAELAVEEILPGTAAYDSYIDQSAEITGAEGKEPDFARAFDIYLLDPETREHIAPNTNVKVTIDLLKEQLDTTAEVSVVHFADPADTGREEPEVLDTTINPVSETLEFETDGFSVYVVQQYTVDFYYGEYEWHIEGGTSILLSELISLLNIRPESEDGTEGALLDIKEVENAEFSDPALVRVEKEGEDWKLTSLQAFDTEEKLRIRLGSGEEVVVRVEDAATNASSSTEITFHTIGNGSIKSGGSGVVIPDGTTLTPNNRNVSNTAVLKTLVTWSDSNNKGITGSFVSTQNTLGSADGTDGSKLYGFYADRDFYNFASDQYNETYSSKTFYKSGMKKFGFGENTNIYFVFKPTGTGHAVVYMDDGDDNGTLNKHVDDSNSATGAKATAKTGYEFVGWYKYGDATKTVLSGQTDKIFDLTKVTEDIIVVPKFEELPKYTYTYSQNQINSKDSAELSKQSEGVYEGELPKGSSVTASLNSRTFVAWIDADTGDIITINKDITKKADGTDNNTFLKAATSSKNCIAYSCADENVVLAYSEPNNTITFENGTILGNNSILMTKVGAYSNQWVMTVEGYEFESDVTTLNGNAFSLEGNKQDSKTQKRLVVNDTKSLTGINILVFYTRPAGSLKVTYSVENGEFVSKPDYDYAGWASSTGATVKKIDENTEFDGWYVGSNKICSNETITATDLTKAVTDGYITADYSVITAVYQAGIKVTYQQQIDNSEPTNLTTEYVTGGSATGYTAPTNDSTIFLGWYEGDTKLTDAYELTPNTIGTVSVERTFTAKYKTKNYATYQAESIDMKMSGVSTYGYLLYDGSLVANQTQYVNGESKIPNAVTAVAANGCEFVGWVITDSGGNTVTPDGVDITSTTIPGELFITEDYTFTAQFQRQDGSIEIIYTIQQDTDPTVYAAKLTLNGKSVEGTETETAYISEVVPSGGVAQGCSAEGIHMSGQDYRIIGWVLGDNNAANKDNLFTRESTWTPVGEYLEDIDGTGVRYFRVVTKKEKNIYIIFKVDTESAGFIARSSTGTKSLNTLIHINTDEFPRSSDVIYAATANSDEAYKLSYYGTYINSGYRLVGFTFNGVQLELNDSLTTNGQKFASGNFTVKNPDSSDESDTYIDLIEYIKRHSKFAKLNESDTVTVSDEEHINILIANYVSEYSIKYFVKNGVGGEVSNPADIYTSGEKNVGLKSDGHALVEGSTAIAKSSEDYVFIRWEDSDGNKVSEDVKYTPDVENIQPGIEYKFYAVFEKAKKVKILYESDDVTTGQVNPNSEMLYESKTAVGATATPNTRYKFVKWIREDDSTFESTDQNFKPSIDNGALKEDDFRDSDDAGGIKTVKFIAHFEPVVDSTITITKEIIIPDNDTLNKEDINTTLYFALTKPDKETFIRDSNGEMIIASLEVVGGDPHGTAQFVGIPYNDDDGSTVYAPNITYTYTVSQGSAGKTVTDKANKSAVTKAGPAGGLFIKGNATNATAGQTADLQFGDTETTSAATESSKLNVAIGSAKKVTASLTVTFDTSKFVDTNQNKVPGIYRYKLTEALASGSTYETSGVTKGTASDDRYLDVYVKWNDAGDDLEVYGLTMFATDVDISYKEGKSIPDFKLTGYDVSSEEAIKSANSENGVDVYKTYNLEVKKKVTGVLSDKTHEFPFYVSLSETSATGVEFYATSSTSDAPTGTLTFSSNAYTLNTNYGNTLMLKNGDNVKFIGLPLTTTATVGEKDDTADTYSASAKANTNAGTNQVLTLTNNTSVKTWVTTENAITSASGDNKATNTVEFTNNLDSPSPTGVILRFAPYIAMIVFAGLLLALSFRRRRDDTA